LSNEEVIDRRVVRPTASASHLIRRVANDHVELHIASKQLGNPRFNAVGIVVAFAGTDEGSA
jgi:hypothetical protein